MNNTPVQLAPQSALVIDDDEFSREILRKNLLQIGLGDVTLAGNGREGVTALNSMSCEPDFLICDIFMPDMDGIEFIAELARRHYKGGLILVTGVNLEMLDVAREIASMNQLNVLGCLIKPLKKELLSQTMGLSQA